MEAKPHVAGQRRKFHGLQCRRQIGGDIAICNKALHQVDSRRFLHIKIELEERSGHGNAGPTANRWIFVQSIGKHFDQDIVVALQIKTIKPAIYICGQIQNQGIADAIGGAPGRGCFPARI